MPGVSTGPSSRRRRRLPGPVADAVDFYRARPGVLVLALVIGGVVAAVSLVDGSGIDVGEAFSMVAIGVGVGVAVAALRRR